VIARVVAIGPHYPVIVTIAFLAIVALVVLVDVLMTRARPAAPPAADRISVDLRRRS